MLHSHEAFKNNWESCIRAVAFCQHPHLVHWWTHSGSVTNLIHTPWPRHTQVPNNYGPCGGNPGVGKVRPNSGELSEGAGGTFGMQGRGGGSMEVKSDPLDTSSALHLFKLCGGNPLLHCGRL